VDRDEIESLIKCGAFDEVHGDTLAMRTRPAMLWREVAASSSNSA